MISYYVNAALLDYFKFKGILLHTGINTKGTLKLTRQVAIFYSITQPFLISDQMMAAASLP